MNSGMVYFVGAGPGDIDLITVKGKQVLQQADVVIFDRLINPFLLTDVKDDAKLIYCGKQPCKHTLRQEDIQKEILIHARKGKTVVRLKGGDPAVFGRVGEEAELLAENHIRYEIIPGITAGIAATMYAGVPITHRKHSNSFAVVTGHGSRKDGTPNVDWKSLSKGVETIVFYMGVKHLNTISEQLIKHGKGRDTQALVVHWGTYSKQRTVEGTLATITSKVEQANITNPAIIVVGDVVKLRSKLAWFDNRLLSGRAILIPSINERNREMVTTLKKDGADVFEHELLCERDHFDSGAVNDLLKMESDNELVFLSTKSVFAFLKGLVENGMDVRDIQLPFYSINESVKKTLQTIGIKSKLIDMSVISPVLVGDETEIESERATLSPLAKGIVVRKKNVSNKDIAAFTRLLEERHINTILLTSPAEALIFLKFLELSGIPLEQVQENVTIICKGIDTNLILKKSNIRGDMIIDNEDVAEAIGKIEEAELALES
ncbi:uroporphyrinogen-III C-methyltransferase [Halalkalibacter flavus]|uniref:uroporphyrinogen-III C-methyltransferase n=1 Tax=Halalkalibacter flavus TaxID=3090668 RepID=UPI002FC5DB7A